MMIYKNEINLRSNVFESLTKNFRDFFEQGLSIALFFGLVSSPVENALTMFKIEQNEVGLKIEKNEKIELNFSGKFAKRKY